jgi:hypothetical protein
VSRRNRLSSFADRLASISQPALSVTPFAATRCVTFLWHPQVHLLRRRIGHSGPIGST